MPPRRFPPPWSAGLAPNCFIVRDADGQALSVALAQLHEAPNCDQGRNDKGYPRYIHGYVVRPNTTVHRLISLMTCAIATTAKIKAETAA